MMRPVRCCTGAVLAAMQAGKDGGEYGGGDGGDGRGGSDGGVVVKLQRRRLRRPAASVPLIWNQPRLARGCGTAIPLGASSTMLLAVLTTAAVAVERW